MTSFPFHFCWPISTPLASEKNKTFSKVLHSSISGTVRWYEQGKGNSHGRVWISQLYPELQYPRFGAPITT